MASRMLVLELNKKVAYVGDQRVAKNARGIVRSMMDDMSDGVRVSLNKSGALANKIVPDLPPTT